MHTTQAPRSRARRLPRDPLKLAPSLRPGTSERGRDPQRGVDALLVLMDLAADHALREWMVGGAGHVDHPPVGDRHHEGTRRRTIVRAHRLHGWRLLRLPRTPPGRPSCPPTRTPWLVKPVYGLLSDGVPLFGRRRQSYFVLTSGLAALAGFALGSLDAHTPLVITALFTAMGLGLAFTDVLTDALMVENGKRLRLTGGFQAVQWASIYAASIAVGVAGGMLTEHHELRLAFFGAAGVPPPPFLLARGLLRGPA